MRSIHGLKKPSRIFQTLGLLFVLGLPLQALAKDVHVLKLSHFMPPVHQQHGTFVEWAKELEKRSDGRLQIQIFPAEQMGKAAEQYDLVRRGDADLGFFTHSIPADRFPLMELTHLPFLFDSAEQASQVLMALLPEYLAAEHRGVKVLYLVALAPASLHTRSIPVDDVSDLKGLRIRHPSSVASEILRSWGASPVGMLPAEIAENLERGVIEGLLIPYDGIIGFQLAPYLAYTTELHAYINTFAFVMNPQSYENLPPDLRQLIDETTDREAAQVVGRRWDAIEPIGRRYARENGMQIISITEDERAEFEMAAQPMIERRLGAAQAKGLPARAFYERLKDLAEQYGSP